MSPDVPFTVRAADERDRANVRLAIERLISELSGAVWTAASFDDVFDQLQTDPELGGVLVALAEHQIVGVLSYSRSIAIRTGGAYFTIQELWVDPSCRGSRIGADLVTRLKDIARESAVFVVEVGLPSSEFSALVRTERFYSRQGFDVAGSRYRISITRVV